MLHPTMPSPNIEPKLTLQSPSRFGPRTLLMPSSVKNNVPRACLFMVHLWLIQSSPYVWGTFTGSCWSHPGGPYPLHSIKHGIQGRGVRDGLRLSTTTPIIHFTLFVFSNIFYYLLLKILPLYRRCLLYCLYKTHIICYN